MGFEQGKATPEAKNLFESTSRHSANNPSPLRGGFYRLRDIKQKQSDVDVALGVLGVPEYVTELGFTFLFRPAFEIRVIAHGPVSLGNYIRKTDIPTKYNGSGLRIPPGRIV